MPFSGLNDSLRLQILDGPVNRKRGDLEKDRVFPHGRQLLSGTYGSVYDLLFYEGSDLDIDRLVILKIHGEASCYTVIYMYNSITENAGIVKWRETDREAGNEEKQK